MIRCKQKRPESATLLVRVSHQIYLSLKNFEICFPVNVTVNQTTLRSDLIVRVSNQKDRLDQKARDEAIFKSVSFNTSNMYIRERFLKCWNIFLLFSIHLTSLESRYKLAYILCNEYIDLGRSGSREASPSFSSPSLARGLISLATLWSDLSRKPLSYSTRHGAPWIRVAASLPESSASCTRSSTADNDNRERRAPCQHRETVRSATLESRQYQVVRNVSFAL